MFNVKILKQRTYKSCFKFLLYLEKCSVSCGIFCTKPHAHYIALQIFVMWLDREDKLNFEKEA